MPIEVYCETCQKKLRVPDTAAGKRIKCPKCQGVLSVPAAGSSAAATGSLSGAIPTPSKVAASKSSGSIPIPAPKAAVSKSSAARTSAPAKGEMWHVQTEDGQQYGPVSRQELDQWYAEGRITVDTQLLLEGGAQWQWASDVYPDLAPQEQPAAAANDPFGFAAPGAASAPSSNSGGGEFNFGAPSGSSTTSVASRGKKGGGKKGGRGRKKGGSEQIDYLAYACYAIGGIGVLICVGILIAGNSFALAISGIEGGGRGAAEAGGWFATFVTGIAIFGLVMNCVWFAAGYGLQERASWGRILALVLGVINLPSVPLGTCLGIWALMVLLDKDNAAAFR